MAAAALAYLALTARVCASSVRSCLAVSTTASSAAWPAGVMIPSCAPATGARSAAMTTDALNETPGRDMYLPPLRRGRPDARRRRPPFLLAVCRGIEQTDQAGEPTGGPGALSRTALRQPRAAIGRVAHNQRIGMQAEEAERTNTRRTRFSLRP